MRLTLRTMLAYLDDILDPSDAQDLGHKIEESEFASSLVGRIRDVSRRLRLGAPKVTGRGMGLDANTVAEYLDNTLSVARVPEFEKICLESDMHLAEVACSHQILALVLGEPAEVNPASRQKMYKLLPRAQDETFAIEPARERVESRHPMRSRAHVPDYLREERPWFSGWMKVAAAVLLLAGLTVAVRMAVGPFNRTANDNSLADAGTGAQKSKVGESPAGNKVAKMNPNLLLLEPDPVETDRNSAKGDAADASKEDPDASPKSVGGEASSTVESTSPAAADSAETESEAPSGDASAPIEATTDSGDGAAAAESETADNVPGASDEEPAVSNSTETDEPAAPAAAAPGEAVGRFITEDVLLRYGSNETGWSRLAGQSTVSVGDHLLSLPTFRSTIALSTGITVQLVGDTDVRLQKPDATGVTEVNIAHGRLVLMPAGRPGAQLRIAVGELRGTITLVDAASVLGIEVQPTRIEGTDPETEPPLLNVDLYVASGQVIWVDAAQATPLTLTGPQHWSWPAAVPEEAAAKLDVPWILGEEKIEGIDKRAAKFFRDNLTYDRPARIQFKEFADDRRLEIRSLSVRCLAAIGDYDALVKSLTDPEKKAGWEEHVDALRSGLAEGPQSAAQVKSSLDRLRSTRSTQLFRMLWGYSEGQLKAGAANQLVEYLDDDNLDLRVVAFCTLERLAGKKSVAYRPTDNPKARQPYLAKWRKWAETYQPATPTGLTPTLP